MDQAVRRLPWSGRGRVCGLLRPDCAGGLSAPGGLAIRGRRQTPG